MAAFLPQEWNYFIWQRMYSNIGDWGWNGVSGCTFICLCLVSEPLHEANSIRKAKIPQKCAMRSRKNTHDFTVFGVVSTPYLPNAWDRVFFRPRVFLWHRVLTISAKMEGILVHVLSKYLPLLVFWNWKSIFRFSFITESRFFGFFPTKSKKTKNRLSVSKKKPNRPNRRLFLPPLVEAKVPPSRRPNRTAYWHEINSNAVNRLTSIKLIGWTAGWSACSIDRREKWRLWSFVKKIS